MKPDHLPDSAPVSDAAAGSAQTLLPAGLGALLVQAQTAQLMQLQMLLSWQRDVYAAMQEARDQWVARFGGGLPIDA